MASIIKVDNVQNQPGTNVINKCGTTITLGASGDTVSLASGASQTGFGRTGTVDWVTTVQTSTPFTAATGKGYFVNTTSGAITANLPAGAAGSIVSFADYAATWDSNALTVSPNGSEKIGGVNADVVLNTEGQSVTFVYIDSTQGWLNVQDSTSNVRAEQFVTASVSGSGNTLTTSGDYKIATFTGPGTFTVCSVASTPANNTVDYLVVAGGGSGGTANGGFGSGGGGAGGFRSSNDTCMSAPVTSPLANPTGVTVTATGYPITVGAGGAGFSSPDMSNGNVGSTSTFSSITSAGGGYAGGGPQPGKSNGGPGGSGGGGWSSNAPADGGAGNTPPVSPPQGNNGGAAHGAPIGGGGGAGGGGAGAVGQALQPPNTAGVGGVGSYMVSTGFAGCNGTTGPVSSTRYFSGGGGGSSSTGSPGGSGGGGKGGDGGTDPGGAGTANTGGGGGGSRNGTTGAGGSGIVIIRYKYQ